MNTPSSFFHRLSAFLIRHPYGIVGACGLFTAIMLALVAGIVMHERHDATLHAVEHAESLALSVERDLSRQFSLLDLSLQRVVDGVENPEMMRLPAPARQQILFDRAATADQYMGALLYVNERGRITVDSTNTEPRKGDFSDRPWFRAHRDDPHVGLFISPPYQSRLRDHAWSVAFSRRVNHPDGSFAGVAVGALRLEYFRQLLAGLNLGLRGSIALLYADGTMVMRNPEIPVQIGRSLPDASNFERFQKTGERWFIGNGAIDGEERIYVYRRLKHIPLLVSVAPAAQDVYAGWKQHAWLISSVATALALVLLGAAWLLAAEFRYRTRIEADLQRLSSTDSLTGLDNRRTLDEALSSEWRRAQRSGKPLALLFIDIDRFKNFNDRYGHQAGDEALAAVARAMAVVLRREGDMVGRFGGEEFVAVLPDTSLDGAVAVAAKIHRAIAALAIRHEASEHGTLTVSIGAACRHGNTDREVDAESLLQAADRALYVAKAGGRNQTATAPAAEPDAAQAAEPSAPPSADAAAAAGPQASNVCFLK